MPTTQLTLTVPSGFNNNVWTTPANAVVSDNLYASIDAGSHIYRTLTYQTNAVLALPANAIILGVQLGIEYRVSHTGYNAQARALSRAQTETGGAGYVAGTTQDALYYFGGSTNSLGVTRRDQLDQFVVQVRQQNGSGSTQVIQYIDSAACWVYWELPPPPPPRVNVLFFGENF